MSSSSVGRAFLALGASRWARRSRARLARSGVPTRRSVHRPPPHPPGALAVVAASAVDELRAEDTRDAALATLVPRAWDPRYEDAGPIPGPRAGPIAIEGFRRGSRSRLMPSDARRFPGDDDFSKLARAACAAQALPRKELYETWEAALIITRAFEDGPGGGVELPSRVMDVAGGHGLLALALLALNPSLTSALVVDKRKPDSFERLYACVTAVWPHVHGRVRFVEASVEKADCGGDVLLASVHACGALTDLVLALASDAGAPVAVVPCCHRGLGSAKALAARIGRYVPGVTAPIVMDAARAANLRRRGYDVDAFAMPRQITPQNRVIVGKPNDAWKKRSLKGEKKSTERTNGKEPASMPRGWASLGEALPESPWRRYA